MRVLSFDVGTKNLAFCDATVELDKFSISSWTVESCVPVGLNVNEAALVDLVPYFTETVKKNIESWSTQDYDIVLIENQPMGGRGSARNLKTKVLSHILQALLLEKNPRAKIQFVHPSLKLKDMPKTDEKSSYRANKAYAIMKTNELVTGDQCESKDLACKIMGTKKLKKDDLSDAFLQAFYFARMYLKGEIQDEPKPVVTKKTTKKKSKAINLDEPLALDKTSEPSEALSTEKSSEKTLDLKDEQKETKSKEQTKKTKTKTIKSADLSEPLSEPKVEKKRKRQDGAV
jgi:hypothetical protein